MSRPLPSSADAAPLPEGTTAPDFNLHTTPDQSVALRDFRGQRVILAFYPADWSPVCGDQMVLYNELLPEFRRYDAVVLGISVDGAWCHLAFAKDRKLHFPLLSDFEPKGEVARLYGVYRKKEGVCERALFVLDENGVVRWNFVSPTGVNPGADGILQALDEMSGQSGRSKENGQERREAPETETPARREDSSRGRNSNESAKQPARQESHSKQEATT
jgi:peroxiredoxin